MKGLRKYLTPFAPDQSGATSVLYELGGLLVICDAGGCAGNVCGFDEPRWFTTKSAIFSAGLRDMDAILGRDDRLVAKVTEAASNLDVSFIAIIGTPAPAVIGTDYRALKRMIEKKTGLPVLSLETNGMDVYDEGEEKAWLDLFKTFARDHVPVKKGRVGIIGMTPQDTSDLKAAEKCREALHREGKEAICYGMGDGIEAVKLASSAELNIVVAPAGLKTAKYLEQEFGTPYEFRYPWAEDIMNTVLDERSETFAKMAVEWQDRKVLIVQQQVLAHSLRQVILRKGAKTVTVASWFLMKPEIRQDGDLTLKEEDDFIRLVSENDYDVILADLYMKRMIPDYEGIFLPLTHFAVSGKLV